MQVSELKSNEVLMVVRSYDAHFDTFEIELHNNLPCEGQRSLIPAMLMPVVAREYGEPDEFVGRQFIVTLP